MDMVQAVTTSLVDWVTGNRFHAVSYGITGLVFLCIALFLYDKAIQNKTRLRSFIPMARRGNVLRKERAKFVDKLIADDIIEMIEFRVFSKAITREEANLRYRKLASLLSNKSLYPDPKLVKMYIRDRLKAGEHKKVKLPDIEDKPSNVIPLDDFGGKFLKRRKAA